jgi:hypothetical protein
MPWHSPGYQRHENEKPLANLPAVFFMGASRRLPVRDKWPQDEPAALKANPDVERL